MIDAPHRSARSLERGMLHAAAALVCTLAVSDSPAQLSTARPPAFVGSGGPKPTLVAPAPGTEVQSAPHRSTPVLFRWSLAPDAPTPARYVLCIAEAGAPCGGAAQLVTVPAPSPSAAPPTQRETIVMGSLHDKPLEWTVAACGPGYGGLAVVGAANADCAWADRRRIAVGYQAPVITLGAPGDRATASAATQRFTWQPPVGVAVDGFRFCLADDAALCTQASLSPAQGVIIAANAGLSAVDVDLRPFRRSQRREMAWTVQSCVAGSCRLAANQPARVFVVSGPPAPPQQLLEPAPNDIQPADLPLITTFRWSPVRGATGYKLCVSKPGVACGTGESIVADIPGERAFLQWRGLLDRFSGTTVHWTVAACDALGCGAYGPIGAYRANRRPGRVQLVAPLAVVDTERSGRDVTFRWQPDEYADRYELEIRALTWSGSTVGSGTAGTWPLADVESAAPSCRLRVSGQTNFERPAPRRNWVHTVGWQVRACNAIGCNLSSESEVRFNSRDRIGEDPGLPTVLSKACL